VLSLAEAQKLCHEAESLIDSCTASGSAFPASQILSVLDWMKGYTRLLAPEPRGQGTGARGHPRCDPLGRERLPQGPRHPEGRGREAEPRRPRARRSSQSPPTRAPAPDTGALVEFPANLTRDENLADFLTEAREHIASGEEAILSLESDLENLELINTVFRSFHTIKGVAGFMNLTPIVHAAHNAEYLLDEARKQTIKLNSSYLDLILESCDVMTQLLGVLDGGPAPKKSEFDRHIAQLQRASKGEQVETRKRGSAQAPPPAQASTSKTEAATQGESKAQAEGGNSAKKKPAEASVKVNTERLDNLVTMVGELVIAQQMVIQDPSVQAIDDQRFQRNMSQAAKIIRDLQEVAMSLRMVTSRDVPEDGPPGPRRLGEGQQERAVPDGGRGHRTRPHRRRGDRGPARPHDPQLVRPRRRNRRGPRRGRQARVGHV
jgi:HPt (histidine-containing phosphotransfer) domain-containing protein